MENGDDADDEGTGRKPRIKISMGMNTSSTKKVKVKRRRRRCKITGELLPLPPSSDEEDETTPVPPRKRKKANEDEDDDDNIPITAMKKKAEEKKAKESKGNTEGDVGSSNSTGDDAKQGDAEEKDSLFLDVEHWKQEREKLDGSFMAARALFTKHGPWKLPEANSERQFRLIAKSLMVKMDR